MIAILPENSACSDHKRGQPLRPAIYLVANLKVFCPRYRCLLERWILVAYVEESHTNAIFSEESRKSLFSARLSSAYWGLGLTRATMTGIGAKLRAIRQQWRLSLREVEQRSRRIAQQRGDLSYQVSASWLARLESDKHELTVNKLIALAEIYSIPTDRLIRSIYPAKDHPLILNQLSSPNATMLMGSSPNSQAERSHPAVPIPDRSPDETTLLPAENAPSGTSYLRGVIGKLDLTLDPMIPAGSIVQIDTRKREISLKNWTHEFQRPIYFLKTQHGYVCGWCELDEDSQWLTLIPHPLSPASSRRLKYPTEVENLGRVMSIVIRLGE